MANYVIKTKRVLPKANEQPKIHATSAEKKELADNHPESVKQLSTFLTTLKQHKYNRALEVACG